jgi:5-methylcytosine-specific restriction protein A
MYLATHPLCVECEAKGLTVAAAHTDHIDHNVYDFWDQAGWQALCAPCHNRKSAIEGAKVSNSNRKGEGGFNL